MRPEIKVSVALPAWNAEKTIAAAIASVLAQDFPDFELLVLDDGSSDKTSQIVSSFNDSRIRLINDGQRMGLASRLNQAIGLARGRYFARMDADDLSFPKRFELQVAFLDQNPEIDLVGCRALAFKSSEEMVGLLPFFEKHADICSRPWRGIPLPHPTWMGRLDWFRCYGYRMPEVLRAEDQELLLRAYPNSNYACLSEVLLGYRQGAFDLRKIILARRNLLSAQVGLFVVRAEWRNVMLVFASTVAKVLLDICASLPGCDKLFFMRMSGDVPLEAAKTLRYLINGSAIIVDGKA